MVLPAANVGLPDVVTVEPLFPLFTVPLSLLLLQPTATSATTARAAPAEPNLRISSLLLVVALRLGLPDG
jgi:hypothetical protein